MFKCNFCNHFFRSEIERAIHFIVVHTFNKLKVDSFCPLCHLTTKKIVEHVAYFHKNYCTFCLKNLGHFPSHTECELLLDQANDVYVARLFNLLLPH